MHNSVLTFFFHWLWQEVLFDLNDLVRISECIAEESKSSLKLLSSSDVQRLLLPCDEQIVLIVRGDEVPSKNALVFPAFIGEPLPPKPIMLTECERVLHIVGMKL